MSVDLEKNKPSILEAYKDVLSDNSETDWYVLNFFSNWKLMKFNIKFFPVGFY